ncbi:MAG TPA: PAS domain-containing protein, partial [Opitutus sp.]|nr:PAS domain-containing protein [Opitutus sp.]
MADANSSRQTSPANNSGFPKSPGDERYHMLLNSIDEGFCVIEMLFDASGRPCDYRFLEINPAFVRHSGLENAQGKRIRELAPAHEQHWFEIYGRVAL